MGQRYEWRAERAGDGMLPEVRLNLMDQEGWEVFSTLPLGGEFWVVARRPISEPVTEAAAPKTAVVTSEDLAQAMKRLRSMFLAGDSFHLRAAVDNAVHAYDALPPAVPAPVPVPPIVREALDEAIRYFETRFYCRDQDPTGGYRADDDGPWIDQGGGQILIYPLLRAALKALGGDD